MIVFALMLAGLVFKLWVFPPDALSDRARRVTIGLASVGCIFFLCAHVRLQNAMLEAREGARTHYLRAERAKREGIRGVLGE